MKRLFLLSLIVFSTSGCTVSIILTDTHGVATDVVDDTATTETEADVQATLKTSAI